MKLFPRRFNLWVSIPRNEVELARAAVEAGADALKVHIAVNHRASGNAFGTLEEERDRLAAIVEAAAGRPVGLVAGDNPLTVPDLEAVKSLGIAFVDMYASQLPAVWLNGKAPLPIMAAASADTPLPLISDLAQSGIDLLEASVMPADGYGKPLTAADLALYRYIRRQVSIPIVVASQRKLRPADMPALAATGADAVMIGAVVTGQDIASLTAETEAFRRAIDAL